MACGLPCVVTDVGDSARVVGDTGMVVPPKNPQALADSILHLLTMDKQKKRELGIAARQRINSLFSIDNIARQYEDLYSNLYGKF
jgi:glycosyltransferase involved in cell wall biosynthesis